MQFFFCIAIGVVFIAHAAIGQRAQTVDTRFGTGPSGQCHIGTSAPFGLTNAAVFRFKDELDRTLGITLLNIQGTGCNQGAMGHCMVRGLRISDPRFGAVRSVPFTTIHAKADLLSLTYDGILHDATATRYSVIHRLTRIPAGGEVVLDLGTGYTSAETVDIVERTDSSVAFSMSIGSFCGHQRYRRIYCVATFQGGAALRIADDTSIRSSVPLSGRGFLVTSVPTADTIQVRITMSLTSLQNARINDSVTVAGRSFDDLRQQTLADWNSMFERYSVASTASPERKALWYSALYRAMQHPSLAEDVSGDHVRYSSSVVDRDTTYERTIGHDIWGFFQTNLGFFSMFQQDMWKNICRTLVEMSVEHNDTPQFDYLGVQKYIMGGDPFPFIAADAILNGTMDKEQARRLLPILEHTSRRTTDVRTFGWLMEELGYIPMDKPDGDQRIYNSVANTIEYATADAANALFAEALEEYVLADAFRQRAARIWNVFDSESGWFRERRRNGDTVPGLDPDSYNGDIGPNSGGPGFKEGSAREFLFWPQQLRHHLVSRLGGWDAYAKKIDPLFINPRRPYIVHNQIQMHLPFQYLYIPDSAHVAHRLIRQIAEEQFPNVTKDLPGNDDLGSTALYGVFVMMGLYPTTAFDGTWLVTAPLFDSIRIVRKQYDTLDIIRSGIEGPYVAAVFVDGRQVATTHIDDHVLRSARIVQIVTSDVAVPQRTRWNRGDVRAQWDPQGVTIEVADDRRTSPLEVRIENAQRTAQLAVDTIHDGERSIRFSNMDTVVRFTIRDLDDPAARIAAVRYSASRGNTIVSVPITPIPAREYVVLADINGEFPSRVEFTDVLGRSTVLTNQTMSTMSIASLHPGVYFVRLDYPLGQTMQTRILVVH